MMCRNPYNKGMHLYPCGQCMPCRVNRKREWTHRIMLEAGLYSDNAFISLTYADQNLPLTSDGLPTLDPKNLQDWLKRFRREIAPLKVRFYACGEYGEISQRPHYHAIVFNYPSCKYGKSRYSKLYSRCCSQCDIVLDTWGKGLVYLGAVETESAQYVCGYVTKKMTSKEDMRLNGRYPEFARMSRKPGIGYDAMHDVASAVMQFDLVAAQGDVPSALRHGSRIMPIGRYLRRELRNMVGEERNAPQATLDKMEEELRALYEAASVNPTSPAMRQFIFKESAVDASTQKVRQMEVKQKIFKKRKVI